MKARLESVGVTEKHFAIQVAINGQDFWQSRTTGFSCGQHGMSSGIPDMDISEAAAITAPFTDAVNGPAISPTIARIGSNLRSQMPTLMVRKCHKFHVLGRRGKWPFREESRNDRSLVGWLLGLFQVVVFNLKRSPPTGSPAASGPRRFPCVQNTGEIGRDIARQQREFARLRCSAPRLWPPASSKASPKRRPRSPK